MKRIFIVLPVLILSLSSLVLAQEAPEQGRGKPNLYGVMTDARGEMTEGFLNFNSAEVLVKTQDNEEKSIPVESIKSITLEIKKDEISWRDPEKEAIYSVRVENSREIYTLREKYTFSLNTKLGIVTRTLDPQTVNNFLSRNVSPTDNPSDGKPFIQDQTVVFSLQIKF